MIKCVVFLLLLSCFVSSELNETWLQNVRIRRQSDSKNCVLPPYPKNGKYTVGGQSGGRPGERYDAVQLHVSCDTGYQPLGSNITYCVFGDWSQDLPQCIRHCRLNPHQSVRYRCLVNSYDSEDGYYRDCEQHEPPGTIVKPECNEPNYYYNGGVLSHMRCIEGRWNYVATCLPECGIITPNGKPLIIGGQVTERGEFPWHAGIYMKTTKPFKLICGGSLVSSTIIISAAHCFWSQTQQRPASDFAIALGKLYREWDNPLDDEAQKYDVVEIKIPVRYQSAATNYQDDIAAVVLSAPAQYRPHVRPVCLNLDPVFNAHQLHEGNFGKVAGWGLIDPQGTPSRVLKVIALPYVKIETCILEAPSVFRPFITSDKICAGYQNGSAICRGDSGGGLVFREVERAKERYYLRGIVSTAPQSEQECNAFERTAFTEIIKHRAFIEKNTIILDELPALVVKEPDPLCTLPPYPANGRYQLSGGSGAFPGQSFLSAQLEVRCNAGFRLDTDVSPSCSLGRWHGDFPKCVDIRQAPCPIAPNLDVGIECSDKIWGSSSPCKDGIPSEAVVRVDCRNNTIGNITTFDMKIVQCENGKFDGGLHCDDSKNCGLVQSSNFAPWVALIYKNRSYTCGATIISSLIVVTAAQCLMEQVNNYSTIGDLDDFIVVAGKTYLKWNDLRDNSYKQAARIRELSVIGAGTTEQGADMALIAISTPLLYNARVQPACMPFPFDVFDSSIWSNNLGKTVTWNINDEQTSVDSAELKAVYVEFVEANTCGTAIGLGNAVPIPKDTICFRSNASDSRGVCRSDTGMGLMYEVDGHYILAGYVIATFGNNSCSEDKQLAGFALISELAKRIRGFRQ